MLLAASPPRAFLVGVLLQAGDFVVGILHKPFQLILEGSFGDGLVVRTVT